jgi:hypothetical protein
MFTYNWLHLIRGSEPTTQMLHTLLTWVPWGIQYIEDVQQANAEALIEPPQGKAKKQMVGGMD